MIIESSLIVALGLIFTFFKLKWRAKLTMLGYPVAMDIGVFVLLCFLHWGSFYGVMAATGGALTCSVVLSALRKVYGHIEAGKYYPGAFNVTDKLRKELA